MTFLEVADRIGARLCRDAIWFGRRCNWIGDSPARHDEWRTSALGADLYAGTSGIGLFLHFLADAAGEPIFRQTAAAAIEQAISQSRQIAPWSRPGFYSGWAALPMRWRAWGA